MDDIDYKWYIAGALFFISAIVCLCTFGFESAAIRFFIIITVLGVGALGGAGGSASAGGILTVIMFLFDGFNSLPRGFVSGLCCAILTVIALLILCEGESGPSGYVPRVRRQRVLKVELVDNRHRKKRKNRRNYVYYR